MRAPTRTNSKSEPSNNENNVTDQLGCSTDRVLDSRAYGAMMMMWRSRLLKEPSFLEMHSEISINNTRSGVKR